MPDNPRKKNILGKPGPAGKGPNNQVWIFVSLIIVFFAVSYFTSQSTGVAITPSRFEDMVKSNDVARVVFINGQNTVEVTLKQEALQNAKYKTELDGNSVFGMNNGPHYTIQKQFFSAEDFRTYYDNFVETSNIPKQQQVRTEFDDRTTVMDFLATWGFLILIVLFFWLMMRRMTGNAGPGGQIFNIGKSRAALFDAENKVKITFDNVAGLNEAKEEVKEIVDFLKNPSKFTKLGGKIPKGALLVGPPGTGKTLLAKAVATQSEANFVSVRGPELLSKWVGESERGIREIFKRARQSAPCVVFFDEIDSIAPIRGAGGETAVTERVVSQLLTELDGMENMHGVIVLAATNRADMIDPALLRPGRFDKIIQIPLPDKESRKSILKINAEKIPTISDENDPNHINFEKLSELTDGLSGADTASIANTAVSLVIHEFLDKNPDVKDIEKKDVDAKVTMKHFEEAVKKVREQKDLKIGEKLVASYYR